MFKLIAIGSLLIGGLSINYSEKMTDSYLEKLGEKCDNKIYSACRELVMLSEGNCAGPVWSGCKYGLDIIKD